MTDAPADTNELSPPSSRRGWLAVLFPIITITFLTLATIALVAAFAIPIKRNDPVPNTDPVDAGPASYFPAPYFMLKERSGAEFTSADLDGKVWIASFVFTRCTMGCPQVTATMAKLQDDFKVAGADDVRLVTFTVDPERDGLEELKKYAANFRADPKGWVFLTGPEKLVRPLLQKGFKVTAEKKVDGKPGDEFDHTTKLFVVDKHGIIRGIFDGIKGEHDPDGSHYAHSQERLRALIADLRKEQ